MSSSSAPSSSDAASAAGHPHAASGRVSWLIAARDWRTVEFVSDLHLSPETPHTTAAFESYLQTSAADAVVILGDLFEVWIGDDIDDDPFARRCFAALRESAGRRTTALMLGNRDFLIGASILATHGVVALDDPAVLDAFGRTIVLAHGDALCLADVDYQAFRHQVRAPSWQAAFLAKPREQRAAMARAMRDASEARKGAPVTETTWALRQDSGQADADTAATIELLGSHAAHTLVHGHTHRPFTHVPAVAGASADTVRHVLSDWDLDDGASPRAEVLRLTQAGFERVPYPPRHA